MLMLSSALLAGCDGGRDADHAAAEAAVRDFETAVRQRDPEALQMVTTPGFYRSYLGLSGSASIFAEANPQLAFGRAVQRRIERVAVQGDTARVTATIAADRAFNVDAIELRLVRREGRWLLDGTAMRQGQQPGGAQVIELTMRDFAFTPDPLFVQRGRSVVFRATNEGNQAHLIAVWSVPRDWNLIHVIEATDVLPEGTQQIVHSTVFAPGDRGDVTVTRHFGPGRYMLACFLSDITSGDLTPHYDLGMVTEFEVK